MPPSSRTTDDSKRWMAILAGMPGSSDFFPPPFPAAKQGAAPECEHRERDRHRDKYARRPETERLGKQPGERDLPEPKAEEIQPRRRAGVPRSVESALETHARRVERKRQ